MPDAVCLQTIQLLWHQYDD